MVAVAPVDDKSDQAAASAVIEPVPQKLPVPPTLLDLARRQAGLVSAEQCDAADIGPSRRRNLVARGGWRRLTRGVYDTSETPGGLHRYDVDRLRSAWTALLANRRAIAAGACALVLHGVQGLPRRIAPEATFAHGVARKSRDGITFRQYTSEPATVEVDGREVVEIVQALVQALPTLSRDQAVACLDSALHQGLVRPEDLTAIRDRLVNRRGSRRVLDWLPLADGRAESPPESPPACAAMTPGSHRTTCSGTSSTSAAASWVAPTSPGTWATGAG